MTQEIHCARGEAIRSGRIQAHAGAHLSPTGLPIRARIPFRSPLREQVLASVCDACWQEWLQMQIKIINELALNLGDARSHEIIEAHARDFLGLSEEPETSTDFATLGDEPPPSPDA